MLDASRKLSINADLEVKMKEIGEAKKCQSNYLALLVPKDNIIKQCS